ncbi:MAG: hypothetical protein WAK83_24485 [Trebonia sp.]|jgi:hypothetical protein|uniref:hypothetical protein n=1 Tax=Trebonia sp. TaxID=2767075 RepID=UPI003BB153F7
MRIRRAIISPLVTLGFAGSVLAGVAVPAVAAFTSSTPVVAVAAAKPMVYMHG